MTIVEMLGQSGTLTLLGLGVVFSFIIILIFAMTLVHKVVHALKLDVEKGEDAVFAAPVAGATGDNKAVVAAIATAVHNK